MNLCNYSGTLIMNKNIEYIAYRGDKFTIEWYFDEKEYNQSQEYYYALDKDERIQLLKLLKRMVMPVSFTIRPSLGTKEIKFMLSSLNRIDFYVSFLKIRKLF